PDFTRCLIPGFRRQARIYDRGDSLDVLTAGRLAIRHQHKLPEARPHPGHGRPDVPLPRLRSPWPPADQGRTTVDGEVSEAYPPLVDSPVRYKKSGYGGDGRYGQTRCQTPAGFSGVSQNQPRGTQDAA